MRVREGVVEQKADSAEQSPPSMGTWHCTPVSYRSIELGEPPALGYCCYSSMPARPHALHRPPHQTVTLTIQSHNTQQNTAQHTHPHCSPAITVSVTERSCWFLWHSGALSPFIQLPSNTRWPADSCCYSVCTNSAEMPPAAHLLQQHWSLLFRCVCVCAWVWSRVYLFLYHIYV